MKLNLSTKGLFLFAFFASLVSAKKNECYEIRRDVNKGVINLYDIDECGVNNKGEVTSLKIQVDNKNYLEKEASQKLFSYKTIKTLKIEQLNYETGETLRAFDFSFANLSELDDLHLSSYDYEEEEAFNNEFTDDEGKYKIKRGSFKISLPKTITKLYLEGIKLTQNNIIEISNLSNLEELTLEKCDYRSLTYSYLSKLSNLKSLTIIEVPDHDFEYDSRTIAKGFIQQFSNIKKLNLKYIDLSSDNVKEISGLSKLDELNIDTCYNYNKISLDPLAALNNLSSFRLVTTLEEFLGEGIISRMTSLKKLTLFNFTASQKIIDEISTLEKLEELKLNRLVVRDEINVKPLTQLKNLSSLELKTFGFSLENDFFSQFENLKNLTLQNENKLTQENINDISTLTNLEELNLYYDAENPLDYDSLKNLSKITTLTLYLVHPAEIPGFVYQLTNLKKLEFNTMNEAKISEDIANLVNLEHLKFVSMTESLPEGFYSLKNLKYLDLDYGKLKTISDKIENLVNLEHFDASSNKIETIPSKIGNLKNLKHLNMHHNKITIIPDLSSSKKLEYLNLGYNSIEGEIPEYLSELPNLKKIYLNRNSKITGKSLNNYSLEICEYDTFDNICMTKDILCINSNKYYNMEKCLIEGNDGINSDAYDSQIDEVETTTEVANSTTEVEPTTTVEASTTVVEDTTTTVEATTTTTEPITTTTTTTTTITTTTTVAITTTTTTTQTPEETPATCKANEQGYQCCSHCDSIYEDETGKWGVEHGQWCGILDSCNEEEVCWAAKLGYSCCNNCKVIYTDSDGPWGAENNEWCGIPAKCN